MSNLDTPDLTTPNSCGTQATLPTLYQGDAGMVVAELQKLLNRRGANLMVDGFLGPLTKLAVAQFQENQGLTVNGIVDALTWQALCHSKPPIHLEDVCLSYNPLDFPHQTAALEWLQNQIPGHVLPEFARRWRQECR